MAYDIPSHTQALQAQVNQGLISQFQMEEELRRANMVNAGQLAEGVAPPPRLGYNPSLVADVSSLAGTDKNVQAAMQAGLGLSGLGSATTPAGQGFFAPGSLGRVHDTLSPDVSAEMWTAQAGPVGSRNYFDTSAAAMTNLLNTSGNVDPVLQDVMARRKAGLEGLTAPEMTAMRESGAQEMDRSMMGAMRAAQAQNISGNRVGNVTNAAMPEIARARSLGQSALERDLMLANVAERNKRLGEYQGLASEIDQNRFNRMTASASNLGNLSLGQQQMDIAARQNYQDFLMKARDDVLKRQIFNLGQLGQEKAGQIGMIFGAGEFGSAEAARKDAYKLGMEGIKTQKSYYDSMLSKLGY